MKVLTVNNMVTRKVETLSKSQVRKIRKQVAKGEINKTELPYDVEIINRIFAWETPIKAEQVATPVKTVEPTKALEAKSGGKVKMTYSIATDVRKGKYGEKVKEIAKALGIGESTARDILKGRTWKNA